MGWEADRTDQNEAIAPLLGSNGDAENLLEDDPPIMMATEDAGRIYRRPAERATA